MALYDPLVNVSQWDPLVPYLCRPSGPNSVDLSVITLYTLEHTQHKSHRNNVVYHSTQITYKILCHTTLITTLGKV